MNDAYLPGGGRYQHLEEREHEHKIHTEALYKQISQFKKAKIYDDGKSRIDQDVEMSDDEVDKENDHFQANAPQLHRMVEDRGIVVTSKESGDKVDIETGTEAFYALLANEMNQIAIEKDIDIALVHRIFYQVCCKREKLSDAIDGRIKVWTTLEDLALKNDKKSKAYQVVLADKGE